MYFYFFFSLGTGRLSILVWFMSLFAAVVTQIHKLLVLRHWLGSFAQECCLWPVVQASRLYSEGSASTRYLITKVRWWADRKTWDFISTIVIAIANVCVGLQCALMLNNNNTLCTLGTDFNYTHTFKMSEKQISKNSICLFIHTNAKLVAIYF